MLAGGPEIILFTWLIVSALWLQQFVGGANSRTAMLWRFPLVVALVVSLTLAQLLPFLDLVAHAQRETEHGEEGERTPQSRLQSAPIVGIDAQLDPRHRVARHHRHFHQDVAETRCETEQAQIRRSPKQSQDEARNLIA